ncbi:MAG TPA: GGDEF domain-containing protein, partial [Ramlibacter sp.]
MQPLVAGFWGAFFGAAALMVAGAVAAYIRALRRVAMMAGSASLLYVLLAACYLRIVPIDDAAVRLRVDSCVFLISTALFGQLVLAMVGHMREPAAARRWRTGFAGYAIVVAGTSFLLPAGSGFIFATGGGFLIGAVALVLALRRAQRGDRLAGIAILGLVSIGVSGSALTVIALDRAAPWQVHAIAAVAGIVYLSIIAIVLWMRFSYLIELQQVMRHGASYDPITRMRTHSETGQMVGLAFFDRKLKGTAVGVIAISIGNLLALEQLHGRVAVHHGLFVSAGRLRRILPGGVEGGRLGEDGFLALVRGFEDINMLAQLGHDVVERMSRPVTLSTSTEPGELESGQANWVAQVGVGIVIAGPGEPPSAAIARARTLSRAAWGFPSRVAWQDGSGQLAEAPAS